MNFDDICVILTNPDESRNIGSACRAMANMGITHLRIIGRRDQYDDQKVRILAIHAAYIWENAEFFDSITEATADCIMAAGTTRRRGKRRKSWLVTPEEFADTVAKVPAGKIAIIFGNERTGLTDEQLEECTIGVNIPSHPDFGSLNLSHAVQIICYTLYRRTATAEFKGYVPISLERLDRTTSTIVENLEKIGFFKVTGKEEMKDFWRDVLSRAVLSESEAAYLEKTFVKAAGLAGKNRNAGQPDGE